MKFIAILLLSIVTIQAQMPKNFDYCEFDGFSHFRGFTGKPFLQPCNLVGSKVLVKNQWIRVTSQNALNDTTADVDWQSTKFNIEFYGETPDVPIATFFSDDLLDVSLSSWDKTMTTIGTTQEIRMMTFTDEDYTRVAYITYERAGITLYLRFGIKGFYFGIRMQKMWTPGTTGMCVTGCSKTSNDFDVECLESLKPICKTVFDQLTEGEYSDFDLTACARDMFLWSDVLVAVDHAYVLYDHWAIKTDLNDLTKSYVNLATNINDLWKTHQPTVIAVKCSKDKQAKQPVVPVRPFGKSSGRFPVMNFDFPIVNGSVIALTEPVLEPFNRTFFVTLKPIRQDPQFDELCRTQTFNNPSANIYIKHPTDPTMFIQCDQAGNAFTMMCPNGTIFTDKITCERSSDFVIMPRSIIRLSDLINSTNTSRPIIPGPVKILTTQLQSIEPLKEAPEFVTLCKSVSGGKSTILHFIYPNDRSLFIECDLQGKAFFKRCPVGTTFTDNKTCESIV